MKAWMKQITLNEHSTEHRYMQIYRQLKELILAGILALDQRLPSVRSLAAELKLNSVTVVKAYDLLEREGLVRKERGSGTYVDYGKSAIDLNNLMEDEWHLTGEPRQLPLQRSVAITADTINFASATPSPDLFPVKDFKAALLEVLDRDQGYAFGYQDASGYDPLREAVGKLASEAGIKSDPGSIQIVSGAQQGIDLVAKGLVYPGETVIIERPSYGGAMQAFFSRSARVIDIPLENDGIDLFLLEKTVKETRPRLLYVMPTFQNPTGVSYTRDKKEKIISLSEKYDFLVLEDDYLNELSFGSEKVQPLKAMDRHDRVIYIKSFSKMFMPGLRLGYLIVPPILSDRLLAAKQATDISTSGLLQRALERYLTNGSWEQNLEKLTHEYHQRFRLMSKLLKEGMPPGVTFNQPAGGLNFWIKLPKQLKSERLYDSAVERKLVFAPGHLFYLRKPDENCLRLSIAAVQPEQIEAGIRLLAQLIRLRLKLDDPEALVNQHYQDPIL